MKNKDKAIVTISIIAVLIWSIYMIKSVLAPFIFSMIIAYFLDPMVDRLEKKNFSRLTATAIILGFFTILLSAIIAILSPIIYQQLVALIMAIPKYIQIFANEFYPKIINLAAKSGIPLENNLSNLANNQEFRKQFIDVSHNVFSGAINSSAGFINLISLIFITPILVFYLLKDWDIFLQKIDEHLPKSIASEVKKIAKDINKTLSGYIRGQFNVCIILAIIYATLLTFSGLNFGFLIGFLTGICSFIPYIGMLGGVIAAIIVGFFQWGLDPVHGAIIGAIFIFGQIVESNFLTPKLIGHKVGLHPVWLIFGLFVFGSLFGFIGVIIAVPLTAIIGVIIKYFSTKYRQKYT